MAVEDTLSLAYCDDGPLAYCVSQGVCYLKPDEDPSSTKILKALRPVGSMIYTTGRTWRGPQGGLWAEVDVARNPGEMGWALVEGPGFNLRGPALIDPGSDGASQLIGIRWLKDPPLFSCLMPKTATIGNLVDALCARTGLNPKETILTKALPRKAPNGTGQLLPVDYTEPKDVLFREQLLCKQGGVSAGSSDHGYTQLGASLGACDFTGIRVFASVRRAWSIMPASDSQPCESRLMAFCSSKDCFVFAASKLPPVLVTFHWLSSESLPDVQRAVRNLPAHRSVVCPRNVEENLYPRRSDEAYANIAPMDQICAAVVHALALEQKKEDSRFGKCNEGLAKPKATFSPTPEMEATASKHAVCGANSLSQVEWMSMEAAMPPEERQTHRNLSLWLQDRARTLGLEKENYDGDEDEEEDATLMAMLENGSGEAVAGGAAEPDDDEEEPAPRPGAPGKKEEEDDAANGKVEKDKNWSAVNLSCRESKLSYRGSLSPMAFTNWLWYRCIRPRLEETKAKLPELDLQGDDSKYCIQDVEDLFGEFMPALPKKDDKDKKDKKDDKDKKDKKDDKKDKKDDKKDDKKKDDKKKKKDVVVLNAKEKLQ
ncbi:unnamed protein product, partial [Polarella glacialis]